ncbi:MAG: hypothetical protein SF053_02950 [Bacteroidia bacterium]|nr:hypothetical protein [Bacteroidia bacterium]
MHNVFALLFCVFAPFVVTGQHLQLRTTTSWHPERSISLELNTTGSRLELQSPLVHSTWIQETGTANIQYTQATQGQPAQTMLLDPAYVRPLLTPPAVADVQITDETRPEGAFTAHKVLFRHNGHPATAWIVPSLDTLLPATLISAAMPEYQYYLQVDGAPGIVTYFETTHPQTGAPISIRTEILPIP